MRLNQRKNINEQEGDQRELRSKVLDRYKNHIEHVIQNNEGSFDSIETPGWTSLMNTEQSKLTNVHNEKKQPTQVTHIQILNRLNSLPKLNPKSNSYSNIRINPSSTRNKNIIVFASVKQQTKGRSQTPRSRFSNKESIGSKKSQREKSCNSIKKILNNTLSNKFLNRFNNNKPNIFFSIEKPSDQNYSKTQRKRVQSVRSQPSENLRQRIQQRLSMGNQRKTPIIQDFQRNICTQSNQEIKTQRNYEQKNNFCSLNSQTKVLKNQKNQYFNRYMNKLSLRNKNEASVKIFKKTNSNEVSNKQCKNTFKMDLIKQKQNTSKRFNSITIHDYLYQDFVKLESKKKVEKMIEDSYKKATTFTFTPFISEKSNLLADSKFERESHGGKKQESQRHNFTECFKKTSKKQGKPLKESIYTVQQQISMRQKQKISEVLHTKTLSRLFSFLSNGAQQLNDKTIDSNIEKLPLSLMQLIEPLLTQVYKKKRFSQKEFMDLFFSTSKQQSEEQKFLKSRRLVIIVQTQKFFKNLGLKKENHQSTKQAQLNFIR